MNSEIERIFNNFSVNGVAIPVYFSFYNGNAKTYITYMESNINNSLSADDEYINYVDYYDFDIYSKGNYLKIVESVIELLEQNGWTWQPSQTSSDLYDRDSGYYHKTLCFAKERSVNTNG